MVHYNNDISLIKKKETYPMEPASYAITGYRPSKLPWGCNETAEGCRRLSETLAMQIAALADNGITSFLNGTAQGVGQIFAELVLAQRKTSAPLFPAARSWRKAGETTAPDHRCKAPVKWRRRSLPYPPVWYAPRSLPPYDVGQEGKAGRNWAKTLNILKRLPIIK